MFRYLFLLTIFLIKINAIEINEKSSSIELLSQSFIYIDHTSSLSKDEVLRKTFKPVKEESLNFGIISKSRVWIRFTLQNTTNQPLEKILEYANIKPEEIVLYDDNITHYDGLFYEERSSLRPTFHIRLEANESKSFLISAKSETTALIAKLTLWNQESFQDYDLMEKLFICAFFTLLLTLLIYNLLIYVFTKDPIYLYYIGYLYGAIVFELIYLGILQIYILPHEMTILLTKATLLSVMLLVIPMILFTMKLLKTERFAKLHFGLQLYLYGYPLIALLAYDNFLFTLNILGVLLPLVFLMLFSGYYAYKKGTKEAILYLLGWGFVLLILGFAILQSLGIFNIFEYFRRTTELAFALEAFMFSIAITYRIKRIDQEKEQLNTRLMEVQKDTQAHLEKLVKLKTKELEESLMMKEVLYQELQHRVKNNLSFIVSLLELQALKVNSEALKTELYNTINRINSFSKLYELFLYGREENGIEKTKNYFKAIFEKLETQFNKSVTATFEIEYELPHQHLLYFGLILNELVTNAFKHAFEEEGKIFISLYQRDNSLYFIIKDNGKGYVEQPQTLSLGKTIVETLVKKQLKGFIETLSHSGTEITIKINVKHLK